MTTAPVARRAGFAVKTRALVTKDLRIEARARDTLVPMLVFSVTVALLLAFTVAGREISRSTEAYVTSGFLWISVLFAGLIAFARSFEVERAGGALDALLLAPLDRSGLYVAKAIANLLYCFTTQLVLVPMLLALFGFPVGTVGGSLLLVVVMVDVGFVAVGTLFAAVAAATRSKELMLPVLSLPALVPMFIAAVELTADVLTGAGFDAVASRGWFAILGAFDVVFAIVGALTFEFVLE